MVGASVGVKGNLLCTRKRVFDEWIKEELPKGQSTMKAFGLTNIRGLMNDRNLACNKRGNQLRGENGSGKWKGL